MLKAKDFNSIRSLSVSGRDGFCVLLEDLGRGVDVILLQVILTKQLRTRLKILGRWIVHSDKNISNKRTSYDIFRDLIQT